MKIESENARPARQKGRDMPCGETFLDGMGDHYMKVDVPGYVFASADRFHAVRLKDGLVVQFGSDGHFHLFSGKVVVL